MGVMLPSSHRALGRVVILGVVCLTGCGGAAGTAAGSPGGPRPILPATSLLSLGADEEWSINRATDIALETCVHRAGITSYSLPPAPRGGFDHFARPFGLESLEDRRGVLERDDRGQANEATAEEKEKLQTILFGGSGAKSISVTEADGTIVGMPGEGCQAEAEIAIYGSNEKRRQGAEDASRARLMKDRAMEKISSSGSFPDSKRRWESCMKRRGFSVTSFDDVVAKVGTTEPASASVAVSDIECKKESGVLDVGYAELAKAEQAELDSQPGVAMRMRQLNETRRRNAQKILSDASVAGAPTK